MFTTVKSDICLSLHVNVSFLHFCQELLPFYMSYIEFLIKVYNIPLLFDPNFMASLYFHY